MFPACIACIMNTVSHYTHVGADYSGLQGPRLVTVLNGEKQNGGTKTKSLYKTQVWISP